MKFAELVFEAHPGWVGGVQARVAFPNGYEVSVIQGPSSYGGPEGLYELAVLKEGHLHYDNSVAKGDVRGYLSEDEVEKLIAEVEAFT
jgi:hypothetical protein